MQTSRPDFKKRPPARPFESIRPLGFFTFFEVAHTTTTLPPCSPRKHKEIPQPENLTKSPTPFCIFFIFRVFLFAYFFASIVSIFEEKKMSRTLIPKGGNDKVMTPPKLALEIVQALNPAGKILEPCKGTGSFTDAFKVMNLDFDYCEIDEGRDFFDYNDKVDWVITNPPYSIFRKFLQHSMELSDNVVFLCLINAFFMKARMNDMRQAGFRFKKIVAIDTPKEFPQMGIQLGVVHIQKNYTGETDINF